ncbi:MAG TPA: SUMF1/EgtB/PvdO family nonheme iron enzyme [Tepidisphaeraceae bacterium]|nr:SUMF1/EgtB/PvdO family nonheme iron enzyme [Tepidisphaeraceae bacterium]
MRPRNIFSLISAITLCVCSLGAGNSPKPFPQWDGKESVAEYAKRAKLEPTLTLDLGGMVKWEGVLIPAGTFAMGSAPGEAKTEKEAAAENQHKVTLTQPFYIGKLELTQAQYQKVIGANPSTLKDDNLPVHNISWRDANDFSEKLGKQIGRDVKLPTEAQWEYACRAGTTTAYYNGNTIADLEKAAWFGANSGGKIHPGGQKAANAWGLYDMLGNAREFVRDCYDEAPKSDATDPTGPNLGDPKNHVVRGGAYTANAAIALNCRCASRRPTEKLGSNGFRFIVIPSQP